MHTKKKKFSRSPSIDFAVITCARVKEGSYGMWCFNRIEVSVVIIIHQAHTRSGHLQLLSHRIISEEMSAVFLPPRITKELSKLRTYDLFISLADEKNNKRA